MLQALSTATYAMPENSNDDDPHQRLAAKILPFTSKDSNEVVFFPITVDEHLSANAQQLVESSCGDSILYLEVLSIKQKHQSKIWVGMKAAAFGIAMHAVIMGLPSAELGMVRHIHTPAVAA